MKLFIWVFASPYHNINHAVAMAYDADHARLLILKAGNSMYNDFRELNPLKRALDQEPDYVLHDPNAFIIKGD